jgi:hypothetical protein
VKEIALFALFAVHAAVFAYFYFRRGRRAFHLLFTAGFVLLTLFYGGLGWQTLSGVEPLPTFTFLRPLRWAGLGLLALATPSFLLSLARRFR